MKKTKEYYESFIGKTFKGFKFSDDYPLGYDSSMDKYIGEDLKITRFHEVSNIFDSDTPERYYYPADLVIEQILQSDQKTAFNPQPYYDNSKGSLYKVATERGWNAYLFDTVKRLERGGKKDPLRQEIEKSIDVLKIWLKELEG